LRQIEAERARFDDLLRSILPSPVVDELNRTGRVEPRRHERVAVLFADISGFTSYCERHEPEEVLRHLEALVREFEAIALRHDVQKIKTIGDAFMAASGLLKRLPNPVENCVRCGVDMIEAARRLTPQWQLRVGIHAGSLVAGLLGSRQYLFDLW